MRWWVFSCVLSVIFWMVTASRPGIYTCRDHAVSAHVTLRPPLDGSGARRLHVLLARPEHGHTVCVSLIEYENMINSEINISILIKFYSIYYIWYFGTCYKNTIWWHYCVHSKIQWLLMAFIFLSACMCVELLSIYEMQRFFESCYNKIDFNRVWNECANKSTFITSMTQDTIFHKPCIVHIFRRLGAEGSYLTLVRVADRIL